MAYSDIFKKVTYTNKDDAEFVEGVSPSISAEQLNAQQIGIEGALHAADVIAADVDVCEENIAMLDTRTAGVICELLNTSIVIPADAWVENKTALRIEAVVNHELIRTDTDVDLILADTQKGRFAVDALDPVDGSITLYTTEVYPGEPLVFQLSIKEVRAFG